MYTIHYIEKSYVTTVYKCDGKNISDDAAIKCD